MDSGRQQTALVAAQQELLDLKGSGRQLLEPIAEAGDITTRAQKVCLCLTPVYQWPLLLSSFLATVPSFNSRYLMQVAAVMNSTEHSLCQANVLTEQLGANDGLTRDTSKNRSEILRRRKVMACASLSCQPAAPSDCQ